jgi:hypothetical protein
VPIFDQCSVDTCHVSISPKVFSGHPAEFTYAGALLRNHV